MLPVGEKLACLEEQIYLTINMIGFRMISAS